MPDQPCTNPERSLLGQIGAHESWARTEDRAARTAPARAKFEARFPNENARKAYFLRLALKSANARRDRTKAAELRQIAAEAVAAADEIDAADGCGVNGPALLAFDAMTDDEYLLVQQSCEPTTIERLVYRKALVDEDFSAKEFLTCLAMARFLLDGWEYSAADAAGALRSLFLRLQKDQNAERRPVRGGAGNGLQLVASVPTESDSGRAT